MANTAWNSADQTGITLSGSNLIATANIGTGAAVRAIDKQITGKFYWETTNNVGTANPTGAGIANLRASPIANLGNASLTSSTGFCIYYHNNTVYRNGTQLAGIKPGAVTNGSVICHALDAANQLYWVRLGAAGNWNGSAGNNPATGVGGLDVSSVGGGGIPLYPVVSAGATNDQWTANFGDSTFTGAVPSGFTAGFTTGASIPLNVVVTQASADHWAAASPSVAVTQAVVEHWSTIIAASTQVVVTQVAVEHWAPAAAPVRRRRVVCVSG
jgi:hypothetical protein